MPCFWQFVAGRPLNTVQRNLPRDKSQDRKTQRFRSTHFAIYDPTICDARIYRDAYYLNIAFNAAEVNMAEVVDQGMEGLRFSGADPVRLDGHTCLRLRLDRTVSGTGYNLAATVDPEVGWAKRRVESL